MKYFALILIGLVTVFFSLSSQAMYFSSYIYEMGSDENIMAKYLTNDTNSMNLYTIQSYEIEKPSNTNEVRINSKEKEILYTPLRKTIDKQSTDFFKLIYRGPQDNKERYYRVSFVETPLTSLNNNATTRSPSYLPSVALSTILIVRPRKQNFQYHLNEKQGLLKNTGNTFFRVIIHQGCNGTDEDATHFYILPGEEYRDQALIGDNKIFLVINKKYMQIGQKCI
ncbi:MULTISPECIES: molecular chaperone [unclassified Acinetobacter]|uniref:molecular chaperone n=1 Tax=unclassified Acinetobacter TaxID=196816 RepID=UPI00293497F9|nr:MULTISPECIES: molecular chaperone [unclassified Acinetobacter]WOE32311.1 molecular chaperone [Acinetobacter sp. SAAs470]WOE37782.1 molecular chaperone [Acinetobacter sp. SAAs474]